MGMFDNFDFSSFDPTGTADPLTGFRPGSLMDAGPRAQMGLQPPAYPPPMDPALQPPAGTPDPTLPPPPDIQAAFAGLPPMPASTPPPIINIQPPPAAPPIRPPVSPTSGAPSNADQTLGAAIGGTPVAGAPMDLTSPAQKDSLATGSDPSKVPGAFDKLGKTLQGVQAPAAPKPMNIGAPNIPRGQPIKTGGLQQVLQLLQGAGQGTQAITNLGQAMRNR